MNYDYSKLNGKIKEVCDTQDIFAKKMGISTTSVNNKLNNKTPFTQNEIDMAIQILNIKPEEIQAYFFTQKVEKN